jgi:hypothetical protein
MTESETRKYIDGRLALARVPDSIRARFDDRIVQHLHRVSAGIPRRLHSAAAEILQEAPGATADDHVIAPAVPIDAPVEPAKPVEPAAPEQTLGVPSDERRVSRRRAAEPEGVPVRVGAGGESTSKGRRAEDRVERGVDPRVSEATAEESVESAAREPVDPEPSESEAASGRPIPDRQLPTAPGLPRRVRAPSRRAIALGSLLVAFVAVAIPVIRSALSEPRQSEAIEPGGSVAREASGEIRAATRAAEPRIAEPPAVEPPSAETLGPLAVQINASPWANVEIDGIDLGVTPLANIPLFAGAHAFRVRMPDGRVIERTVEIDAERRFISFE